MYTPPVIQKPAYPSPATPMSPRSLRTITDLIFHHTAGPAVQSALAIDQEHRNEGWCMIGYNYVIDHYGTISEGRPAEYVPSAAYGRNAQSINVCLTGNFQSNDAGYTGEPSPAQINSAKLLAEYLHKQYPTIVRTIGHCDVARMFFPQDQADYATACPGNTFYSQIPMIKTYVLNGMKAT